MKKLKYTFLAFSFLFFMGQTKPDCGTQIKAAFRSLEGDPSLAKINQLLENLVERLPEEDLWVMSMRGQTHPVWGESIVWLEGLLSSNEALGRVRGYDKRIEALKKEAESLKSELGPSKSFSKETYLKYWTFATKLFDLVSSIQGDEVYAGHRVKPVNIPINVENLEKMYPFRILEPFISSNPDMEGHFEFTDIAPAALFPHTPAGFVTKPTEADGYILNVTGFPGHDSIHMEKIVRSLLRIKFNEDLSSQQAIQGLERMTELIDLQKQFNARYEKLNASQKEFAAELWVELTFEKNGFYMSSLEGISKLFLSEGFHPELKGLQRRKAFEAVFLTAMESEDLKHPESLLLFPLKKYPDFLEPVFLEKISSLLGKKISSFDEGLVEMTQRFFDQGPEGVLNFNSLMWALSEGNVSFPQLTKKLEVLLREIEAHHKTTSLEATSESSYYTGHITKILEFNKEQPASGGQ